MPDVDGSFNDPDGRKKVFVSLRPGESSEAFVARAMSILFVMSDILPLERVVMSMADDWEKLPTTRWLEARHRTYPKIHLRVTVLPSCGGGSVGHLIVDDDGQQVADEWGDRQDNGVYLPRAEDGRVSNWQSVPWRLVHQVQGVGDEYDKCFERSGIVVERGWLRGRPFTEEA